jgi:hypothetical protein
MREKKQKKDLTGPTLLEISEYATYRDLVQDSVKSLCGIGQTFSEFLNFSSRVDFLSGFDT